MSFNGCTMSAVSDAEKLLTKNAEYLALEAASPVNMQFVDGVAYAMAGGHPRTRSSRPK